MRKKAVALAYEEYKDRSPKVVAKGRGTIADKIIKKAEELKIPIFCNEALVDSLVNLELDSNIPEELYVAVIDVFVWLQNIENDSAFSK